MQLAGPGRAESRKQSLLRDRVLNKVDVSIEVEPEWAGADLPHGHDGRQVSFLAATDQRQRGAVTRRFRDAELNLRRWNRLETASPAVLLSHFPKTECQRRSVARCLVEQPLHEFERRVSAVGE